MRDSVKLFPFRRSWGTHHLERYVQLFVVLWPQIISAEKCRSKKNCEIPALITPQPNLSFATPNPAYYWISCVDQGLQRFNWTLDCPIAPPLLHNCVCQLVTRPHSRGQFLHHIHTPLKYLCEEVIDGSTKTTTRYR